MPASRRLFQEIKGIFRYLDFSSLRVRLTVGVATVSVLGLGSVAIWTSLRMQHILISTQKQILEDVADRFAHDVEIYSEMVPIGTGVQKAIDNRTTGNTLIWVKNNNGELIAQSPSLEIATNVAALLNINNIPLLPELQTINGRYWLLCASPLEVKGTNLGRYYLAKDITDDQIMFLGLIRNLSLASLLAIALMILAIALYIRHSLQPLQRISQLTATISADRLGEAHIYLENAPSEVKQLAQTFDEMLVRLSQAWEHQRQLVSNVSHELRTPLTIVSGYIQSTLRRGNNLTQTQREALETAASEADRTIQLMQDLLDLARAESGRMHFQLEAIVINDWIGEVIQMAKRYSDRRIELESPAHPIVIKADANRLKQVLLNLIDNAVKYSDTQIKILLKQGDEAIIQISDRGVGIPLQQQSRIFERFYRVDEARHRAGGTGLGLSIVKILVEGMGGRISVRSQPGEGSTFTISFPKVK